MLYGYQLTPDGKVFVRNGGNMIYGDTKENFALDYDQPAPALIDGAVQELYEPGKRHLYADADGVIGGGDMPWQWGDDVVAACDRLLAAQVARNTPAADAPAPVPGAITRRQLLIQLKTAGLISADEAVAAAQSGAVPAAVQAVFDTLPTQEDRDNAAITWASMSIAERGNALVAALAASQGMTSEQIDDFFRAAAAL